jgi:hypothetical protein
MNRGHAIVILHLEKKISHRGIILNIVCENWDRRPPLFKRAIQTTDCGEKLGVALAQRGATIEAAINLGLQDGEADYRGEARRFV